ncbi:MAG: DUF2911 domain-containing protein [Balneolaceae bacterium]|nr:DUF2911 domain-containing protein [Balneolaceae bacterium]MBO6545498.1 DUF2911 domain-containing protein [Balneolaceae bacterium]MBO6646894.1 DUF2911 domain-containing protein [Balneolaceae bacterium]
MKQFLLLLIALASFTVACGGASDNTNQAAYVTKLGNDTLAVEVFEKTETGMNAKVILRSPETSFSSYKLTFDELGGIKTMVATRHSLEEGFGSAGDVLQSIVTTGDSLEVEMMWRGEVRTFMVEKEQGVLPFIDMVHWPFELAFQNAKAAGVDTVNQPLLSGTRISNFIIAEIRPDSMTLRHPSRGVMGTQVSESGHLEFLDAGLTTRKLKVYREPASSVNINALGKLFARKDIAGNPFGELSSAEENTYYIGDAEFVVSYGSPKKRGRDLFGGIVPWGERWRTGANRATHFYTSEDLTVGGVDMPAGEYTLFTIPQPDGGTLIINKQTGQNGRTYDESRDLVRVPMTISSKSDITEAFTITVEETDAGGSFNLIWGQTLFSVPFEIN